MKDHYNLLITNGELIDPGTTRQKADIAIKDGRIAFIGKTDPNIKADQVLDASDHIVTPGLIDMHVHTYWGVSHYGIEADPHCLNSGVTTAIDAGSAGAWTFPAFRRYIMDTSATRLFAFLNISSVGMVSAEVGELEDIRYADVKKAVEICKSNIDVILGIKVRLSNDLAGKNDMKVLKRARKAADILGIPIMVHPPKANSSIKDILAIMKKGDILTHCYHGHKCGILNEKGKVRKSVIKAVEKDVLLDVGHGMGSFTFEVAAKAIEQGILPYTISSDLHFYNTEGPVFDLATTISKFLYMGIPLKTALEMCITRPAQFLKLHGEIGVLKVGAQADISVFEIAEGKFKFVDCNEETRIGNKKLIPKAVVCKGKLIKSEKDRVTKHSQEQT